MQDGNDNTRREHHENAIADWLRQATRLQVQVRRHEPLETLFLIVDRDNYRELKFWVRRDVLEDRHDDDEFWRALQRQDVARRLLEHPGARLRLHYTENGALLVSEMHAE